MSRWTVRRDGTERVTIQVRYHVPRQMIDFITDHTDLSTTKAIAWLRHELRYQENAHSDFYRLAISDDGEPGWVVEDDVGGDGSGEYWPEVYEGQGWVTG